MAFETPDFAAANPLADLMKLVKHLDDLYEVQEKHAADLKAVTEKIDDLVLKHIPAAMGNLDVEEITLNNGRKLVVLEDIFTGITKANREAAHKWLRDHGAGAIIKQELTILGEERVKAAMELCQAADLPFNVDESIHASTLKKFVRESLESGENIPHDLFSLHIQKRAELK